MKKNKSTASGCRRKYKPFSHADNDAADNENANAAVITVALFFSSKNRRAKKKFKVPERHASFDKSLV